MQNKEVHFQLVWS